MGGLNISPIVSDGMIIQREAAFPIWSREKLKVTFMGKTYESKSLDGKWLITLDPVQSGGPFAMEIVSAEGSVSIKDIYAGDVWLCAGQSNMEMQMDRLRDNFPEEWNEDFPLIRQFKAPQEWDFNSPREDFSEGNWLSASAQTLHEFSGTAWFFAKEMYKKHRIPIGLINTAWGGTPIESWMSVDALKEFPNKTALARQYADADKCREIIENTAKEINEWQTNLVHEDEGFAKKWQMPQTDISDWKDINLPGDFSEAAELKNFCGVIWIAKDFEADANFIKGDAAVWLGTIVDSDIVYINGVEIGTTGYRYPPRKYAVKEGLLKEGKNRIVIRVTCNNGEGGVTINKPFSIFTDNKEVQFAGTWKYKTGAVASARPQEFFFQWQPVGNYNAMIAPVLKFPLKGVIWYQGESNGENAHEYAKLFRLMIEDWRQKNGGELPFIFVQLPIWLEPSQNNESSSWATIREAQTASLSIPATGMAAALELGEWNDIHPLNKKDVGLRLFLAADKMLFKGENTSPGPLLRRVEIEKKNGKLYLFFDNCGSGLSATNGETPHVSVADNGVLIRLAAKIEGIDSISVDLSTLKNPQKVLYAWADNPRDRQLFNSEGLPVIPFKANI